MQKIFDKSKVLNYITAGIYLISAIVFIKQLSFYLWQFDIFNMKQVGAFLKYIGSGKIFNSLKYMSFIITFIGLCIMTYSGIILSMNFEFLNIKVDNQSDDNEKSITQEAIKNATLEVEKSNNKTNEEEKTEQKEDTIKPLQEINEQRFAMYNANNTEKPVLSETEIVQQNEPNLKTNLIQKETLQNQIEKEDENNDQAEEDRIKLQAKIKEIMQRMKERKEETENEKEILENKEEKVIEPTTISKKDSLIDMNFRNISEEENAQMEHTLISSGFKLLSEIRIGSTGIDYLGVAKDKILVVQVDTSEGNWFASEDKVEGNNAPVWFSELGNKTSPVARAIEARNNISELIKGEIDLPIETVACLTNSKVVNITEAQDDWDKSSVKVVQLNNDNEDIDVLSTLEDLYPFQSQEDIDENTMNKLISILEKAEIPE